jgi:hypothetical protein
MNSIRRTRRHLFKAAALVTGAAAALPARAQSGSGGGKRPDPYKDKCFLRGTRILTARGYRRIETLAVGDRLPTRFGGLAEIKRISSHLATTLVRVKPSAIADNVPSAELCLTESHAIFTDGVLVPIGDLVNDVTIVAERAAGSEAFEFFHVELEGHDVIEAEGTACETLRTATMTPCAPMMCFGGGRGTLASHLRSAMAPILDRRRPLDIMRDRLEQRGLDRGSAHA